RASANSKSQVKGLVWRSLGMLVLVAGGSLLRRSSAGLRQNHRSVTLGVQLRPTPTALSERRP
ncbi:hypothetical protein ACFT4A_42330, partial [Streptomyces sp. NPDC057099]|uniref:hypothetical protein n=1 Tax=Streptomyces sp. NPDC057099 TaxID=3346019 RepID=UPI0036377D2B